MPRMPTFEEIRDDFERGIRTAEQHIEHPFRRHYVNDVVTTQAPAQQPVNLATATAAAPQQEDTMSLITDAEDGFRAVENEYGKFRQALPGALAKAKAFEASPFAAIAEKAAASVLPPEAVAIAVNGAEKVLDDLISLYGPPQNATDPAPAGQQPVVQGAPAQ